MTSERLSALDASFLAVESPAAPMHVGWVAAFAPPATGPRPGFDELFAHIAARLEGVPRYRQRLAGVPLGLHQPLWVEDPDFAPERHLHHAAGDDLDAIVDAILSTPLARDGPLWEIWIADGLPDRRVALIGKMHHCMVDGQAVVQLGNLLLDGRPDTLGAGTADRRTPPPPAGAPPPPPTARLARAVVDRAADAVALVLTPLAAARSPRRVLGLPRAARRAAGTLAHTLLPPAPPSDLNRPGAADRHHVRVTRPVADLRRVRRRLGVTPNDVVLAATAGALRRLAQRRGTAPEPLKVMVPADVRSSADARGTGNRISFVFVELPCHEPDPVARLRAIHRQTAQRSRDGDADILDAAFRTVARTPPRLQHAVAQAFAHPRLFNLTVASVPGPAPPRYLRGCRLETVHSAVPLAPRHALSVGVVTVAGNACFGIYADATTLPDADALAADLDAAMDELLERADEAGADELLQFPAP